MARQARIFSNTGLYHIMVRGSNKEPIFSHTNDYVKFKEIISTAKDKVNIKIYAYCMMPNHIHLFLREENIGDISDFMKRILSHYAGWYNFKYKRTGHLFANRYKSIPVEEHSYLLVLSKYIHLNPVVAGITDNAKNYRFSSYSDYLENNNEFTDIDFLLDMFDDERSLAIKRLEEFTMASDEIVDFEEEISNRDLLSRLKIIKASGGIKPLEIKNLPKEERNKLLKELMEEYDINITALSRLTGITRSSLSRLID